MVVSSIPTPKQPYFSLCNALGLCSYPLTIGKAARYNHFQTEPILLDNHSYTKTQTGQNSSLVIPWVLSPPEGGCQRTQPLWSIPPHLLLPSLSPSISSTHFPPLRILPLLLVTSGKGGDELGRRHCTSNPSGDRADKEQRTLCFQTQSEMSTR